MLQRIGSRLTYANVIATAALFVALGGGAYALSGVPDRSGVYHGCVATSGALRVVANASSCRKAKTVRRGGRRVRIPGESAIAWNQQGRAGANGTNGLNGANGANGATKVVVRHAVNTTSTSLTDVNCAPGEVAVGGGGSVPVGSALGVSRPNPAPFDTTTTTATGWEVISTNSLPAGNIRAWVLCASP